MLYDIEFGFSPNMTVGQVNETMDRILDDLDGCMADEYDIDATGLKVMVEFDCGKTTPDMIREWLKDNEGVTADLEDW